MELDVITLIFNQGVAIGMLIYFIFRGERKNREHTEIVKTALDENTQVMREMHSTIKILMHERSKI